jgi:hypothetical protein
MAGPIDTLMANHPPRPGFRQRICNYSDDRMEKLLVEGYQPVLTCLPVIFDVGGGQKAILMEIPERLYTLRTQRSEIEEEIERQAFYKMRQRMDAMSSWQFLKKAWKRLWKNPAVFSQPKDPFNDYRASL